MKNISLLFVLVLALCLIAHPVSAHVLKYDGDIAAVLHIQPDDNPTSDKPTSYDLFFTDNSNRFTLPACNCTVSVQENGKTISTQALTNTSLLASVNTFTFPKPDVYTLIVSGKPIKPGVFQAFTLNFPLRVESGDLNAQAFPTLLWLGLGSMIALIMLGGYASNISYNDNEKS